MFCADLVVREQSVHVEIELATHELRDSVRAQALEIAVEQCVHFFRHFFHCDVVHREVPERTLALACVAEDLASEGLELGGGASEFLGLFIQVLPRRIEAPSLRNGGQSLSYRGV